MSSCSLMEHAEKFALGLLISPMSCHLRAEGSGVDTHHLQSILPGILTELQKLHNQ